MIVYLLLFSIIGCINQSQGGGLLRNRSVICLKENQNEVYLRCTNNTAINLIVGLQGAQLPDDTLMAAEPGILPRNTNNGTCSYVEEPECSTNLTEWDNMLASCMGQSECVVPITPVIISACGRKADYVQVEYECLQDNTKEDMSIIDICGDILNEQVLYRQSGFIETPNYPDEYPPEISCTCQLTAMDAEIVLTLLDLNLEDTPDCHGDWLEYQEVAQGQLWGHGTRVCEQKQPNMTYTARNTINVNFKANAEVEGRGFWMKYLVQSQSLSDPLISISCNRFIPHLSKTKSLCFKEHKSHEQGEILELDCKGEGRMDLISIQQGNISPALDYCDNAKPICLEESRERSNVMYGCQGHEQCTFPIMQHEMDRCPGVLNYMHVTYQCIQDKYDHNNIVNICDSSSSTDLIRRRTGYVVSPLYPNYYPHNIHCSCTLQTAYNIQLQLKIQDLNMKQNDWLIIYPSNNSSRDHGLNIWNKKIGDIISTNSSEIILHFESDSQDTEKGFWVQYTGVSHDGRHAPVTVQCRSHGKDQDTKRKEDEIKTIIKQPILTEKDDSTNIGLILGATFVILSVIVIIAALFAYKKHKRSKNPKDLKDFAASPAPPTISSSDLDRKYMTLNSFSPLAVSTSYTSATRNKHHPKPSTDQRGNAGTGIKDENIYDNLKNTAKLEAFQRYVEMHPDYDDINNDDVTVINGGYNNKGYTSRL